MPNLLARQISTLDGVAQVQVFGAAKYAVRIQADPDALAARGIGIDTLADARSMTPMSIRPPARSTAPATPRSSIPTASSTTPTQFRNQIIAYSNGAPVRLGDVANVIDSVDQCPPGRLVHAPARRFGLAFSASPAPTPSRWSSRSRRILPQFQASLPAGDRPGNPP